jgi:hypothetical protein
MLLPIPSIGPIERFMEEDHVRLDRLLESATRGAEIDPQVYASFRHDLLRHIAMEEKVLLPYAREKRGGVPLPNAPKLRADHGEIAKLLVRSPTHDGIDLLRELLARHNPLEEGENGLYALCDALAGDDAPRVVARLQSQPEVPVAAYYDGTVPRRN